MLRQGLAIPGFLILKGRAYFPSIQCLNQLDLRQLVNWNFLNLKYIAWKCTKPKGNFEFRILNSKLEMGHLNSEFWIQNSKWDIWIQNSEFKIRNGTFEFRILNSKFEMGHSNSEFWIQNSKWDIWIQNSEFKIANGTCEFRILNSNFQPPIWNSMFLYGHMVDIFSPWTQNCVNPKIM